MQIMEKSKCPYCESEFDSNEDLSRHIDRIHGDSGLLEGASRKSKVDFRFLFSNCWIKESSKNWMEGDTKRGKF